MSNKTVVGAALRERLGDDGSRALVEYVEQSGHEWRGEVLHTFTDRVEGMVEGRMNQYADRNDLVDGFARIANQIADVKVDVLRWSFAFWVGQLVAIGALFQLLSH